MLDGLAIDSPEAVIEHMEDFIFPKLKLDIENFNEDSQVKEILEGEKQLQEKLGSEILKTGYNFIKMPIIDYYTYGYKII